MTQPKQSLKILAHLYCWEILKNSDSEIVSNVENLLS